MSGSNRTIGFSNCERYFAKGTRGIHGVYTIPDLATSPNNFLTWLFSEYNKKSEEELVILAEQQEKYKKAMADGKRIINSVTNAESANNMISDMSSLEHALTSEAEIKAEWNKKINSLGLVYDKAKKAYVERGAA